MIPGMTEEKRKDIMFEVNRQIARLKELGEDERPRFNRKKVNNARESSGSSQQAFNSNM